MLKSNRKLLTRLISYSGLALYGLAAPSVQAGEAAPGTNTIHLAAVSTPAVETAQQSQTLLAMANQYRTGHGVKANPQRAFEYYKRAARMGLAEAQFQLASMYLESDAIRQSEEKALKWLELAAEQGHTDARFAYTFLLSNTFYDGC